MIPKVRVNPASTIPLVDKRLPPRYRYLPSRQSVTMEFPTQSLRSTKHVIVTRKERQKCQTHQGSGNDANIAMSFVGNRVGVARRFSFRAFIALSVESVTVIRLVECSPSNREAGCPVNACFFGRSRHFLQLRVKTRRFEQRVIP